MDKLCFVIQRFDKGHYDKLFRELFKPAIEKAGFKPYRVDEDPSASIPIESIERMISDSHACFAEISEDNPNVWFEFGYAIAKEKPMCLVCSEGRERFPFDVQHRKIIRYPALPAPSDYENLKDQISGRLVAVAMSEVSLIETANTLRQLSVTPETSGLAPHEVMALSIIFQGQLVGSPTGMSLLNDMERSGFNRTAAALAVAKLKKANLIFTTDDHYADGEEFQVFRVTPKGEDWLLEHQTDLQLKTAPASTEISDDDIPF